MTPTHDTDTAGRELVITRLIDAPRERVFQAWTSADRLAKWWGPRGFTTTTHHMDFREGGVWRYVMHGPDGRDYENRIVYREIVAPERIVYLHDDGGEASVEEAAFNSTATFEAVGDDGRQTRLTLRMVFPTAEERERIAREYGAVQGGIDTVTRLAEHVLNDHRLTMVAALPNDREIIMSRRFNAPRTLVFQAWTDPALLKRWMYAFDNHELAVCEVDARVGGTLRYVWLIDGEREMGMSGAFLEIDPPSRLVHTERFDQDWTGGETRVTTQFDEIDGQTTVTMTIRYNTREARDSAFESGMLAGVASCYGRLDGQLAGLHRGAPRSV